MSDLVTRLRLDSGQHNSELDKSKQKVHQYKEEADKAGKSVEEMGSKQTRSAKELLDAMSKIEGQTRSTSNYRAQLAQITKQISDLTINYRAMNAEMQNSDIGREVVGKIQELTIQAAGYKDAIMDAQNSIKNLASDTSNWDAMKQGIDVVSSSLQAFVGAGVLGEKTTKKLVDVIAKLKAIEAATNAVIKIGNALQKDSALMLRIQTAQTNALARAKNLEAAATGRATLAQKAFNLIAKSNPYLILATAVISLIGVLAIFTKRQQDVEKAAKTESEAMKAAREEAEKYKNTLASTTANVLSKYKLLQIEYGKLKTSHEKNEWIKKNKTEFDNLGIKVNDLKSAEDAFKNNTASVVEALKKRALAMAQQNRLTDLYSQLQEEELRAQEKYRVESKKIGDKYLGDINERNRHMFTLANDGHWVYNAQGVKEENEKIKKSCFAMADSIQAKIDSTANNIAGLLDVDSLVGSGSGSGGSGAGGGIKVKVDPESLKAAEDRVNELREKLSTMSVNDKDIEKVKNELAEAENKVANIKSLLETSKAPEYPTDSLRGAEQLVSRLQEKLNSMSVNDKDISKVKEELEEAKDKVKEIQQVLGSGDTFEPFSMEDLDNQVSELTTKLRKMSPNNPEWQTTLTTLVGIEAAAANMDKVIENARNNVFDMNTFLGTMEKAVSDIQFNYDIGLVDENMAKTLVDNVNKELKKNFPTITLEYKLELKASNFEKYLEAFDNSKKKIDEFASSMSRAYDSIADLGDKLDNEEDAVKRFFMIWDAVSNVVSAVQTLVTTGNAIVKFLDDKVTKTGADAVANAADAAAANANAAAQQNLAAATGAAAEGMTTATTATAANTLAEGANAAATATSAGAKSTEAAAAATNAAATDTETASTGRSVIAKISDAIAGAAKAVSSIPVIGPVLAVAAIAAVIGGIIAAISKAKSQKFSQGGIFKAPSGVNDKNYAQLNNGEMVLNTQQQKKLFQMLNSTGIIDKNTDSGSGVGGNVRFVIEGDKLVGTLDNYNRKIYHSRR